MDFLDGLNIDRTAKILGKLLKKGNIDYSSIQIKKRSVFGGKEVVFDYVSPIVTGVKLSRLFFYVSDKGVISTVAEKSKTRLMIGRNELKVNIEDLTKPTNKLKSFITKNIEIIKDNV